MAIVVLASCPRSDNGPSERGLSPDGLALPGVRAPSWHHLIQKPSELSAVVGTFTAEQAANVRAGFWAQDPRS